MTSSTIGNRQSAIGNRQSGIDMLRTWIHRIRPGMESRLREWFDEVNARAGEVRESFAATGVRAEQAFVVSDESGSLLIYVSEADDHAAADRAFAASSLAIDVEHRNVMAQCIERTLDEAPVYDMSS
jgi:hypothetical protein